MSRLAIPPKFSSQAKIAGLLICIVSVAILVIDAQARRNDLLHLPEATLLLGAGGIDYLALTTATGDIQVLPEKNQPKLTSYGSPNFFSLSRDGSLVASPLLRSDGSVAVATFSIADKKWTELARADYVSAVSISPDKSKLAYVAVVRPTHNNQVYILDVKTGLSKIVTPGLELYHSPLSWDREGRRLVYEYGSSHIEILQTETGQRRRIAEGRSPSWSPSGEWIAYYNVSGRECRIIHPDGTGDSLLFSFGHKPDRGGHGILGLPPVWSSDSSRLLLDEERGSDVPRRVLMYDLRNHQLKRLIDGVSVLGWSESK